MDIFRSSVLLPVVGILIASCVKSGAEPCPPQAEQSPYQYTVRVGVLDKNYSNAQQYDPASVRREDLPLKDYVGTLYYELEKSGSDERRTARIALNNESCDYTLAFNDLTSGQYILTVWGGGDASGMLHSGGDEGFDLYLGRDTLEYASTPVSEELLLRRVKGKVRVVYKNLPAEVVRISQQVGPVYQNVAANFVYTGNGRVIKAAAKAGELSMLAAPTPTSLSSVLSIGLFTAADAITPSFTVPDIPLTVRNNQVSLVEIDYNGSDGSWEIWATVDGQWKLIHNETLEEN